MATFESNIITEIQNEKETNINEFIKFNIVIPRFANKESIEIYMQTVVNFYDNNPKFDYI